MATLYGTTRYNYNSSCWWRLRVDYSGTSATAYVDVGPSGWSIWLNFNGSGNTFGGSGTYYASNNGASANKLGSMTISETSSTTITQTCSGSDWGGDINSSSSVTIPAQKATYTISYNANGGSGAPGSQTKIQGTAITLSNTKPTRSSTTATGYKVSFNANGGSSTPSALTATNTISYSFKNWYSSSDGGYYNAGASYSTDASSTMTAQWNSSTSYGSITLPSISKNNTTTSRTVSLDASSNGGLCGTGSLTSSATVSYSLKGWYTSSSGGTDCGGAGSSYKPDKARTLYAQWNSSTGSYSQVTLPGATKNNGEALRRLTFDATTNGGSCSTPYTDTSAVITYTQTGWWTSKSGGTNRGNSGSKYTPSASETLYAQFSSSTGSYGAITLPTAAKANSSTSRTITFNGNGGTTPSSQTSTATITYTQTGWFSSASGGANRGAGGAKYTPSANETVYAQFSSSIGDYSAIELPTPTRTDYVFKGWSTDPNATSGIVGSYTPPSDITLYATWVEDQAKASVKVNGSWVKGKVYYKKDGQWVKVKKVYRKIDGQWKIGRNS